MGIFSIEPYDFGRFLWVNNALSEFVGYPEEQLLRMDFQSITPPEEVAADESAVRRLIPECGSLGQVEKRYLASDGTTRWGLLSTRIVCEADGHPLFGLSQVADITQAKREQAERERTRTLLAAMFQSSPVPVYAWRVTDDDDLVLDGYNDAGLAFTRGQIRDLRGVRASAAYDGDSEVYADLRRCARERATFTRQVNYETITTGESRELEVTYAFVGDDTVMVHAYDLTDIRRAERELTEREEHYRTLVQVSQDTIFLVDTAGVVQYANRAAERLLGYLPEDLLGRQVQEFLAPDSAADDLSALARVLEGESLVRETRVRRRDGSFAFARFNSAPVTDADGQVTGVISTAADITEMKEREGELREHLRSHALVGSALSDNRLLAFSQPIVDMSTGRVVQEELLVRMRADGPGSRIVSPCEFLPAAERSGAIEEVDRWMVSRAVEVAAAGRAVHVNVSARSLGDPKLTAHVERRLEAADVDARQIVFEVTETAAIADVDSACEFAERISQLGCRLALDDFGTGFGSLTYLRRFPLDYLKIDASFVQNLTTSEGDQRVVRSIVNTARDFGLATIAEGVETEANRDALKELGVDYAQGFLFGHPEPVA